MEQFPGARTCRAHPPVLAVRLRVVRPVSASQVLSFGTSDQRA